MEERKKKKNEKSSWVDKNQKVKWENSRCVKNSESEWEAGFARPPVAAWKFEQEEQDRQFTMEKKKQKEN